MSASSTTLPLRTLGLPLQSRGALSSGDVAEPDQLGQVSWSSSQSHLLPSSTNEYPGSGTASPTPSAVLLPEDSADHGGYESSPVASISTPLIATSPPPAATSEVVQPGVPKVHRMTLYPIYGVPRYTSSPKIDSGHEPFIVQPVTTDFSLFVIHHDDVF